MARRFVRLRFALLRAGFRTGNLGTMIGTVLGLAAAAMFGVAGCAAGVGLRWVRPELLPGLVQGALALILAVWVIGPITIAGTDAAMDPVRFVLLPLRRRDLAGGLTAAALIGPGGLATSLTMLGIVIGTAPAGPGLLAVVIGAAAFLVLCALTSRLMITLVGLGLRRRGLRDLLAVAIPLSVVLLSQLPNLISQLIRARGADQARAMAALAERVLAWLPTSLPGSAILAGQQQHLGRAVLFLAATFGLIAVIGAAWASLLRRVMTTPPAIGGSARVHRTRRFRTASLLPWLPARAAAVSDKDLILIFREPAQRAQLIMMAIMAAALTVMPGVFAPHDPRVGYLACVLGVFLGMVNANAYGYDGPSMWMNVVAGDDARADLLGKGVARLLVYTPVVLLATVTLCLLTGPSMLLGVLGCSLGGWALGLGLALAQSAIAPYPVTYAQDGLMARNNGSLQAVIAQLVSVPVLAIVIGPWVVASLVWPQRTLLVLGCGIGALVSGLLAGYGAYRLAVAYGTPRQSQLLELVSKRAAA